MTEQVQNNLETNLPVEPQKKGWKSALAAVWMWIRAHPIWTVIMLLFALVLVEYLTLPGISAIERLKKENPKTTALMKARVAENEDARTGWKVNQRWVPLSRMSPHLIHAVVVAEDGSFYDHEGFDWYEVRESFEKNIEEGRFARGASTITQQLAKNLYLSASKDPIRKLKEAIITMQLESSLSKNRLLEIYLNVIEWGNGVFGAEAAALRYFGKSASDLSREEAARMAAVIPRPLKFQPDGDSRYVRYRQKIILARMESRGW